MRSIFTLVLLIASNVFMTLAWYGHLKWKPLQFLEKSHWIWICLVSWGIAFFEYLLMIPANRLGSKELGGNFDLFQLKIIQEVIGIVVFTVVVVFVFKGEMLHWRHILAFLFLLFAVVLVFWK